ncbi:hypothetical protein AOLI_G00026980 [Acnodon oligacanthus]
MSEEKKTYQVPSRDTKTVSQIATSTSLPAMHRPLRIRQMAEELRDETLPTEGRLPPRNRDILHHF